jgi:hypothetical protein
MQFFSAPGRGRRKNLAHRQQSFHHAFSFSIFLGVLIHFCTVHAKLFFSSKLFFRPNMEIRRKISADIPHGPFASHKE